MKQEIDKKDSKLNRCEVCNKPIKGKWDSQVYLGMETGELDKGGINRWLIYDKHIKCSPSRAQRIIHPAFPPVVDSRSQFDMRRGDNVWTNEMREKWIKVYTEAWVKLQEKYNPSWITEPEELVNLSDQECLRINIR